MSSHPWTLVGLHASVRFTVVADSSPALLLRLLEPFARRDLAPDAVEARIVDDALRADIAMDAMPAEMVHLIEGNLRQIIGVRTVTRRQEITGQVRRAA